MFFFSPFYIYFSMCFKYSAEANKEQLDECEKEKHLGAVDVSLR